jgi:hypothetical protein
MNKYCERKEPIVYSFEKPKQAEKSLEKEPSPHDVA